MSESERKRTVEEIDAEIAETKKELESVKGSECEVYARIVGYYRSVKNWNKGKREEYGERKLFSQPSCGNETAAGARKEAKQ